MVKNRVPPHGHTAREWGFQDPGKFQLRKSVPGSVIILSLAVEGTERKFARRTRHESLPKAPRPKGPQRRRPPPRCHRSGVFTAAPVSAYAFEMLFDVTESHDEGASPPR